MAKVSIEPVIATSSNGQPLKKKIVVKKVIKKMPAKKYADASSGVPLEVWNQRLLVFGIFVTVVTVIAVSSLIFLRSRTIIADSESQEEVEETTEEAVTDQDLLTTPKPEDEEEIVRVKREDITLEILNGSGVSGLAGNAALEMQELGYPLPETGNSARTEVSELYISESFSEDQLDNLLKDVKRRFGIDKVTDTIEIDFTARIILGEDQK